MVFCRDSPSLDEMTQCIKNAGPIFILQCRFEELGGKIRVSSALKQVFRL